MTGREARAGGRVRAGTTEAGGRFVASPGE